MEVSAHIIVHGRVQGVGFRYFVSTTARRLGLAGYVCNRADGSVELRAEGERERIDELLEALRAGPRLAQVTGIDVSWSEEGRRFRDFTIE